MISSNRRGIRFIRENFIPSIARVRFKNSWELFLPQFKKTLFYFFITYFLLLKLFLEASCLSHRAFLNLILDIPHLVLQSVLLLELNLKVHLGETLGLWSWLVGVLLNAAALEATFENFAGHFLLTALTVGRHNLLDGIGGPLSLGGYVRVSMHSHEASNARLDILKPVWVSEGEMNGIGAFAGSREHQLVFLGRRTLGRRHK